MHRGLQRDQSEEQSAEGAVAPASDDEQVRRRAVVDEDITRRALGDHDPDVRDRSTRRLFFQFARHDGFGAIEQLGPDALDARHDHRREVGPVVGDLEGNYGLEVCSAR
jgi:hypothetical protein